MDYETKRPLMEQIDKCLRIDLVEQIADRKALCGVPFLPAPHRHGQRVSKLHDVAILLNMENPLKFVANQWPSDFVSLLYMEDQIKEAIGDAGLLE